MSAFQRFVGIDWSGAKGEFQPGIAIAQCGSDGTCRLLPPPTGRRWSRETALDHVAACGPGTLVGFDFAFSLPWPEVGPFPSGLFQPPDAPALWEAIDELCRGEAHFYAGPVYRPAGGRLATYAYTCLTGAPTWVGSEYRRDRLRSTELALPRRPSSVFHIVGAATVGPASFSGMRILLALRRRLGDAVAIWPFDDAAFNRLTIAEIYPGFYRRRAGSASSLNDVLAFYGATLAGPEPRDGHERDALIAAAAMRREAERPDAFTVSTSLMRQEGWIFGVPVPREAA